jgi:hypothetical protein
MRDILSRVCVCVFFLLHPPTGVRSGGHEVPISKLLETTLMAGWLFFYFFTFTQIMGTMG